MFSLFEVVFFAGVLYPFAPSPKAPTFGALNPYNLCLGYKSVVLRGRWNKTMPISCEALFEVWLGDFMRFLSQFTILLLLLAVLVPVAFGGNVEDGLAAAESGDF